jgi:hypothetical protein
MTDNARITQLADGVTSEMIAEQVHIFYDPATQTSRTAFQGRASLFVNNAYQPLSGTYDSLLVTGDAIMQRCFATGTDPVTGADLSKISGAGMDLIFKAAYDVLYNERATGTGAFANGAVP